jgi:hypothetical protein
MSFSGAALRPLGVDTEAGRLAAHGARQVELREFSLQGLAAFAACGAFAGAVLAGLAEARGRDERIAGFGGLDDQLGHGFLLDFQGPEMQKARGSGNRPGLREERCLADSERTLERGRRVAGGQETSGARAAQGRVDGCGRGAGSIQGWAHGGS